MIGFHSVTPSAAIFYTANAVIVSGYIYICWLFTRARGVALDNLVSIRGRVSGFAYFALCGVTHGELAWHGFQGTSLIHEGGTVQTIHNVSHVAQAIAVWVFVTTLRPIEGPPTAGPFLRQRCWWWRQGQPPADQVEKVRRRLR